MDRQTKWGIAVLAALIIGGAAGSTQADTWPALLIAAWTGIPPVWAATLLGALLAALIVVAAYEQATDLARNKQDGL